MTSAADSGESGAEAVSETSVRLPDRRGGPAPAGQPNRVDLDPENWAAAGSRDEDYLRDRPPHW